MNKLEEPLIAYNVDGTINKKGTISHLVTLQLEINGQLQTETLMVTGLGKQKIILGFPWLRKENPNINWKLGTLT